MITIHHHTREAFAPVGDRTGEVCVRVGGTGGKFVPEVLLTRWNSAALRVRLRCAEGVASERGGIISYYTPTLEAQWYPVAEGAGGFEFGVWVSPQHPTNQLVFDMATVGLTCWPQGDAPQRPDWAINSLACYGHYVGDYTLCGGWNYRAGKAFHVHRVWAEDEVGHRIWCPTVFAKDRWTINIPAEFRANAVGRIFVDPTFGYTTIGGSVDTHPTGKFVGLTFGQTDGSGGTVSGLKIAIIDPSSNHVKLAIYPTNTTPPASGAFPTGSMLANSSTGALTITRTTTPTVDADLLASGALSATVAASTYYWICIGLDNPAEESSLYYDSSSAFSIQRADSVTYASFPPGTAPVSYPVNDARKFTAYATYAADAGLSVKVGRQSVVGRGTVSA